MANFYVGQKVVCVDASPNRSLGRGDVWQVKQGGVYTVRTVENFYGLGFGLTLEECKCVCRHHGPSGYAIRRFRPVVEQSKGMELIRAIVANPKREIPADPREPALTPNEMASIPGGLL